MTMRMRVAKGIDGLLWLLLVCLGAPMTLRFLGMAFYAIASGLDGGGWALWLEAAVELLPLGVSTAATMLTLWRLEGWPLPKWWWIALSAAWIAACVAAGRPSELPATLPLLTTAVMLALHGLRCWMDKETEESNDEYEA